MGLSIVPFSLQLPSGYALPSSASSSTTVTSSTTSTNPIDVVRIGTSWDAGGFTAVAGDVYRLNDLFHGQTGTSKAVAGYRLALGDGSGLLTLDGVDVTDRSSFTADEFARLTYTAGADGSQQALVAVAQTGTRLKDGTLSQVVDSPAIQITARVTGHRSINAMSALAATPSDGDAAMVGVVKEAGILVGTGAASRPRLQADGNFTAVAGDVFRMADLFAATPPAGKAIAGYRVALGAGNGHITLDSVDVSDRTSFTADEFARLTYTAGGDAGQQDIVVVGQLGTRLKDGTLAQVTDSPAVQITANVTGSRSIGAMGSLATTPSDADAAIVSVVKEAGILTGIGAAGQPTLVTTGNFTAVAGEALRLNDLFAATAASGKTIAGYRVALGAGSGQMLLDGADVAGRSSFTATEFSHLTYIAGADATPQNLVVVAQTGTRLTDGTLSQVVDSAPIEISATASGSRSINAMGALLSMPTDHDATIAGVVKEAGILVGMAASARPTLRTQGNFTAVAGDVLRLSDLFSAGAPTGKTVAGYRVALGAGDGTLLLNGNDVAARSSFTAAEFAQLTYTAGTAGTAQNLVVVAQTRMRLHDGTLVQTIDSPALQITATAGDSRSLNTMSALATTPSDSDGAVVDLVKQAGILAGISGSSRPTLQTQGNFTAVAGDVLRLNDLFAATAPKGHAIAGYRLALGDGDGTLTLNNVDVTDRTSFTADEFAHLTYTPGGPGSRQNLIVVAQTGTRLKDGTLSQVVDSAAVQVTATVGASRTINAMGALLATPADADAMIAGLVKEAGILMGLAASSRPSLQAVVMPDLVRPLSALASDSGAYQVAGATGAAAQTDLASYYPGAVGGTAVPGTFASPGGSLALALLLLDATASGAFETANKLTAQSQAIRAYVTSRGL